MSPSSLIGSSTNKMYIPRQDKFEGYSQLPRPRLPPDAPKFGSFFSRQPAAKALGEIYRGEPDKADIPVKELLEQQAKRRL